MWLKKLIDIMNWQVIVIEIKVQSGIFWNEYVDEAPRIYIYKET